MKDKLNKFMQGRYGIDQFARFTLGVALFVIVIGSFLRRNVAGGILDTLGFILIIYTYFRIFPEMSLPVMRKIRNIWVIRRKSAASLPERRI